MNDSTSVNRSNLKQLAIRKIPLFSALSETEKAKLVDTLLLREFKKGANIIISAAEGRDIMFIADGSVDIKRAGPNGREVIVARLNTGDFFGEIALLTGASRTADVTAVEDSMILVLRASDFESLLESVAGLSRALLVHLAHRVAAASTRIADLALFDVYFRVFRALKSIAKKDSMSGDLIVKERPTHKELASMVGTSREMVTRALSKLQEDEILEVDDKQVKILNDVSYE